MDSDFRPTERRGECLSKIVAQNNPMPCCDRLRPALHSVGDLTHLSRRGRRRYGPRRGRVIWCSLQASWLPEAGAVGEHMDG